jgi:putative transposase
VRDVVGATWHSAVLMSRHTAFRSCLNPTIEQRAVLARHAGAARFAFNQCLRMVKTALTQHKTDPDVKVPWSKFDQINAFNAWKKTDEAGRMFVVDQIGGIEIITTGLAWRGEVCQQVFEEAAVDCGRALAAWSASRSGKRKGKAVGFPRFKRKSRVEALFRMRNKHPKGGRSAIRVGDSHPRSVTLPGIGEIRVHDDTRPLRRLLAKGRAKILFATVTYRAGRWSLTLNVDAADLHPVHRHSDRDPDDHGGWVGVDRGLSAFLVAARSDGAEVARVDNPPKALSAGLQKQRRLAKSLSRKRKGSNNRHEAAERLRRHHHRVRNIRQHFLHQVTNELVKTHDRLVIEDLTVAGMLANRRLARAISDAGWSEFARMLHYKQLWRDGQVQLADRWFPSSQICSECQWRDSALTLADRVFACENGHELDRDLNAAVNLAKWGQAHRAATRTPDLQAGGRATNVRRRDGADQHPARAGETSPEGAETVVPAILSVNHGRPRTAVPPNPPGLSGTL